MSPATTPPDAPCAGVTVKDEDVVKIVERALPRHSNDKITVKPLQSGASFNNRIYFININDDVNPAYVLKVNGKFFGAVKVENEVCSLLLLKRYCCEIPVPRVIAWSTTGDDMTVVATEGLRKIPEFADDKVDSPAWILLTCRPGSKPDISTLSNEDRESLSARLGAYVASWREQIPASAVAGGLRFLKTFETNRNHAVPPNYRLCVGEDVESGLRLDSLLMYFRAHLERQLTVLETDTVFAATREQLLPVLRQFISEDLPKLPIMREEIWHYRTPVKKFLFTWRDMAPRNILIAGSPPKISGIVDFEFAGFCPDMEEFSQEWSPDNDDPDWSPFMYDCLVEGLERASCFTTGFKLRRKGASSQWRNIYRLREQIAPWWIVQREPTDTVADVEQDVLRASEEVQTAIRALRQMTED